MAVAIMNDMTANEQADELHAVAAINGVPLHAAGEALPADELRRRACTELLRQAAQDGGLLAASDTCAIDGAASVAATEAIEVLLEQSVRVPQPSEEACRRFYAAHEAAYRTGERVRARHILFAVTFGVDVVALRKRAEMAMLDVRCFDGSASPRFVSVAADLSNCPSGAVGGELGWLAAGDCAPEFARELFGKTEIGILPRLVHSRFGLHVVEVLERDPGVQQHFEAVRGAVVSALRQQTYVAALRQFLQVLAGQADVQGVDLDAAATPLVQ